MASIKPYKNGGWIVHYDNPDGKKRNSRAKTFTDYKEAKAFKAEVELKKVKKKLITPGKETVEDLFLKFLQTYGTTNWDHKTYATNKGYIFRHILPELGDKPVSKVTPMEIEEFLAELRKRKADNFEY